MSFSKLTARQRQALRLVHDFISQKGSSPTLAELKSALSVASDQSVIEMLQRLENKGMVEKTAGQARSLKLTAQGCLAIGAPVTGGAGSPAASNSFNSQQQYIFKRLTEIEPKLAKIYMGGLRALLDETNPDRIAHSAHSMREITFHLSNMGKELVSEEEKKLANDNKESINALQLNKLLDPQAQGVVHHFDQNLYEHWNKNFHQFFIDVSHHNKEVSIEEYLNKLSEFESFLSRIVLPLQTEFYELIDKQISNGPENADPAELTLLITRNLEACRYFFKNVDIRWLKYLHQHGFIVPTWEAAEFLVRMAPNASEEVMKIIEGMEVKTEHPFVHKILIDASLEMPPKITRRILDKIIAENWEAEANGSWLVYPLQELLKSFIKNAQHADALRLAKLMLQQPGKTFNMRDYHYGETLKKLSAVPSEELSPYKKLFVQTLDLIIAEEFKEEKDDGSSLWRPAIEDNKGNWHLEERKDNLVVALRNTLRRYIEHLQTDGQQNVSAIFEELLKLNSSYAIFKRIKLHFYRQYPANFKSEIESLIVKPLEHSSMRHEYSLLLKETFPQLDAKMRAQYFDMVDRGPEGKREEAYIHAWKSRQLSFVIEHLSPTEKVRYKEFLPDAAKINQAGFLSTRGEIWRGPTSPIAEDGLSAKTIQEVIEYLISWKPERNWLSSSRSGLARTLSIIIQNDVEKYSKEAHLFLDLKVWPIYISQLLSNFREALKNDIQLDWKNIISFAAELVERASGGALPTFEDPNGEAWEADWDGVFQELAFLFERGLYNHTAGPSFKERDKIWKIIEFLCEHPDPTEEYEQKYNGDNCVRSRAFEALFAYIFWCDRHLDKKNTSASRVPEEAKNVLRKHLNPSHDPSLAVRSVYGRFFPWLFEYDPAWTSEIIDALFPSEDRKRRCAAWERYLLSSVFPNVFRALKAQYNLAISEVKTFKTEKRYGTDLIQRLAEHMAVAYVFRMEEDKGATWLKFFQIATPKQRGMAVSFLGRAYVMRPAGEADEMFPDKNRLQEFWEWRLSVSKDPEELEDFGWWIIEGRFNNEWMLDQLINTLEKTKGALTAEFEALRALSVLVSKYPLSCAKALSLIVHSKSADRSMLGHNKDIPAILSGIDLSGNADAKALAIKMRDHFIKLGFKEYMQPQQRESNEM